MHLRSTSTQRAANIETKSPNEAGTRLTGLRLLTIRAVWTALIVLSLAYFIANLPVYFVQLQTVCIQAVCVQWQLTPVNARTLQDIGLSVNQYAIFTLTLNLFSALVWFATGVFIAWRKSDDWLALLTALFLIIQGVLVLCGFLSNGGVSTPLAYSSPTWYVPNAFLYLLDAPLIILVFSLFPNGRFVPGWMRWLVPAEVVLNVISFLLYMSLQSKTVLIPFLSDALWLLTVVSIIGGQIYRYQRVSSPMERQQTKWIIFATIVDLLLGMVYIFSAPLFLESHTSGALYILLVKPLILLLDLFGPLCFGIAILRYRLWDIDVIINRTLVYGVLTVSIVALYILVVVGLGTLFQAQGNLSISLLATGLIAVLFQPLRTRLQRVVNQLMYGERDDPYGVLSRLGQRLEATLAPDAVLPTIVETVAQALKLPYTAITLKQVGTFTLAASYGSSQGELLRLPLIYQTEQVGELILAPRTPDETFTSSDRKLLADLAHQAGVAAHAVRLTDDLKQLTVDLQHSRERLVTAREEERRRLRRDLHDGLGPQLAGLTLKLETARNRLAHDALADTLLSDLTTRTQTAVADIRRLVYALRPPVLDELGLLPALWEQALQYSDSGANGLHVHIDTPEHLPELSAAVEVAVYRIAQEALTNVVRHAHARHCDIQLALDERMRHLTLEVQDDGGGMPAAPKQGVGLLSMRERAEELGGTWTMQQRPTGGTCVSVTLPYRHLGDTSQI